MQIIQTSVIDNIKINFESLFPAEKKVAQYILNNLEKVVFLNISELAKKSHSSESSVVRMAKHLGYKGYFQMRLLLSNDISKKDKDILNNQPLLTSEKIFRHCADRVQSLANTISTEQLINAAKLIQNSRICHIVSIGNTTPVAIDLGFRLERNGQACTYTSQPEQYYNHIALGKKEDLLIAITRSGASRQVLKAIDLAKKKDMKILIITAALNKEFIEQANCILQINNTNESTNQKVRADSHLLEIALNDALIYVIKNYPLFDKKYEQSQDLNEVELLLSETKL